MKYVYGILIGLAWGAVCGLINCLISKKALKKDSTGSIMGANMARIAVDIAAMTAVLLLFRGSEKISMELALVGTAVSLSAILIVFAFRAAAGKIK